MGSVRTLTSPTTVAETQKWSPLRVIDVVLGGALLILSLPLMGVLALAVSHSSNGPVFHRERTCNRRGRPVELLSFRIAIDGSGTAHHERMRAVVGAQATSGETTVGRMLRASRAEQLPRLFNVVRGDTSLF